MTIKGWNDEIVTVDEPLTASDENLGGTALLQNQSLLFDFRSQIMTLHSLLTRRNVRNSAHRTPFML